LVSKVKISFELNTVSLKLAQILPVKQISDAIRHSAKYRSITASVKEIGVIEPLVVHPAKNGSDDDSFILLDGHIRLEVLKELGEDDVLCVVSTDDEGYTYNDKVNRLAPIQEHFMIMKAIRNGVAEERIAKVLCVDVASIKEKRNMIKGLCPEAVELLKDKQITSPALALMRKVKPMRQIEIAELMIGLRNYTRNYVRALVAATSEDDLLNDDQPESIEGLKPEDLDRMRREMSTLEKDFRAIEDSYGSNVLDLTLARGYLSRLLENGKVVRFLSAHHRDILDEFNKILESSPLDS
jgi:hypothetical protein